MPPKFKPSATELIRDSQGRSTGKTRLKHFYLHTTPTEEIVAAIKSGNKKKHHNKFKRELDRRGVALD
tara:strand:+ start:537 stop:740 length:204 start_codon:yes stop_codon:yes gene_type:complete